MFKYLADQTAIMLITNNIIAEEKREAYAYGFELFFEKLFFYGIIFVNALLTKTFLFSTLFIFFYKMLRQYTGGFHCKTAKLCLVVSVMIYLVTVLIYMLNSNLIKFILAISAVFSTIIIFIFSPRENKNRPLENEEKRKYRTISIIIAAVTLVIVVISYNVNVSFLFYSASSSLTADAVLIILSLRRCRNERENDENFGYDSWKEYFNR